MYILHNYMYSPRVTQLKAKGPSRTCNESKDDEKEDSLHPERAYLAKSVFQSFCRSQLPHEYVNFSFNITNVKSNLKDLCGN